MNYYRVTKVKKESSGKDTSGSPSEPRLIETALASSPLTGAEIKQVILPLPPFKGAGMALDEKYSRALFDFPKSFIPIKPGKYTVTFFYDITPNDLGKVGSRPPVQSPFKYEISQSRSFIVQ